MPKKLTIHQRNIQNYQKKYPKMPKNSTVYLKIPENIQNYQKNLNTGRKISAVYPKISKIIKKYQNKSKNISNLPKLP